jgi:hypothetical protein
MLHKIVLLAKRLPDLVNHAAPSRPRGNLGSLSVDDVPVVLPEASVEVDVGGTEERRTLPKETGNPEDKDNRDGQNVLHNTLNAVLSTSGRNGSIVALSNQDQDAKDETQPGSVNTTSSEIGDLIEGTALGPPSGTETDVAVADRSPGNQAGQSREGKKPVKDGHTTSSERDVGEGTKEEVDENGGQRATGLVNVGEELGGVALLGKSSQGARSTVDTRNTDRDNGDADDQVHEVIKSDEATIDTSQNEGGYTIGVGVIGVKQAVIGGADEQADKSKTKDIEEGDTPEDLLDSTGKGSGRVLGLGSCKTDELSACERKGSGDEDGAETREAVLESTRIVPKASAPVLIVSAITRTTTADQDNSNEHEDDDSGELEAGAPKLLFGITERTEDVDDDDDDEKECDPDSWINSVIPVCDGEGADDEFEGQDDQPLEDVIPTHGETPRRINKASRIGVETSGNRVHDSELSEGVDNVEDHDTGDGEADEDGTRATTGESATRTDEETGTDGTTDGNHVQVAGLHGLVERDDTSTAAKRAQVETVAGSKVLLVLDGGAVLAVDSVIVLVRGALGGDTGVGCDNISLLLRHYDNIRPRK